MSGRVPSVRPEAGGFDITDDRHGSRHTSEDASRRRVHGNELGDWLTLLRDHDGRAVLLDVFHHPEAPCLELSGRHGLHGHLDMSMVICPRPCYHGSLASDSPVGTRARSAKMAVTATHYSSRGEHDE